MKYPNNFKKGIDKNTNLRDVDSFSLRDGVNIDLLEQGEFGVLVNFSGTEKKFRLIEGHPEKWRVLGRACVFANVMTPSGSYDKREGLIFFTTDSENGDRIKFYDIQDDLLTTVYKENLDFDPDGIVHVKGYSDRSCTYVFFADGKNELRKLELRIDRHRDFDCEGGISGEQQFPDIDELSVIKKISGNCLTFKEVVSGGGLPGGSYSFFYRKYNTQTCRASVWSSNTPYIPALITDENCSFNHVIGAKVGEITNKKIILEYDVDLNDGYDSIQLLVVKQITGSKANAEFGYLLRPNKEWYQSGTIEYTGVGEEVKTDLADILIDDIALKSMGSFVIKSDKIIGSNYTLKDFELDNGELSIDSAQTIQKKIGDADMAYKCETDSVNCKTEFRGEQIAYGIYIYDKNGQGVVCPLDLSSFSPTKLKESLSVVGTVIETEFSFFLGTRYIIYIDNADIKVGDYIKLNNGIGEVVFKDNSNVKVELIEGSFTLNESGPLQILMGQSGNQSDNWTWKYPQRSDNQYTIFDEDGDLTAIGLKITGLKNWPSWACGFEIVRGKREKNIVGQTPHIPIIGVQGAPTMNITTKPGGIVLDYNGQHDFAVPKTHIWGHARNIVCSSNDISGQVYDSYGTQYVNQSQMDGFNEIPKAIFAMPPEFMYGNEGLSFDYDSILQGTSISIVDGVALKYHKYDIRDVRKGSVDEATPVTEIDGVDIDDLGIAVATENTNLYASKFHACNRDQYFYNRERLIRIGDNYTDQQELGYYLNLNGGAIGVNDYRVGYYYPIQDEQSFFSLPKDLFSGELNTVKLYGNADQLAAQQIENDAIIEYAELYTGNTQNQKGLIIGIDGQLQDFTALMWNGSIELFPLLDYEKDPNVLHGFETTTPLGTSYAWGLPVVESGKIIGGAYILNIEKGLGADRYGNISDPNVEWCRTGICQVLSETDIINNKSFDFEIYAGDAYLTKHSFKIMETSPRVTGMTADYALVDDAYKIDNDLGVGLLLKTGRFDRNVEHMTIVLESEINSNYESVVDQFPALENDQLSNYNGNREYYYNPAYSHQNCLKPLVSKSEQCKENNVFKNGLIASETHLRGATSNEFIDIEGFDRFKANNIFLLDGRFGDITMLIDNNDYGLTFIMEKKIGWIGIGLDQIQTADGILLATGTNEVFGNSEQYVQRDVGSQDPLTIIERDGFIYGVDRIRKSVWRSGPRGGNFEMLSDINMKNEFDSFLDVGELHAHIDTRCERYILTNLSKDRHTWVFNILSGFWGTSYDFNKIISGIGGGNDTYWLGSGGYVHQLHSGARNTAFGEDINSSFIIAVNPEVNIPKIFEVIEVHGDGKVKEFRIRESEQEEFGEWKSLSLNNRTNRYWNNVLRKGISKVRGEAIEIQFRFSSKDKVSVYSIITQYRKIL